MDAHHLKSFAFSKKKDYVKSPLKHYLFPLSMKPKRGIIMHNRILLVGYLLY